MHFGEQVPTLVREAKKGHGPLGRLVYRLHLQKYLSEGSTKLTSQITKVLKPATAFSVGAAAVSTLVTIVTIGILTFFTMLEAPRMWRGLPQPLPAHDGGPPAPGRRRVDPLGDGLHAGERPPPR